MTRHDDEQSRLLDKSWHQNAQRWTQAVRQASIVSRSIATDQAVVGAIIGAQPKSVIDVGCGEGWLVRRLNRQLDGHVVGIDQTDRLIENARQADPGGCYLNLSYQRLSQMAADSGAAFDVAVCNFSLFERHLNSTLTSINSILTDDGLLIIQSVHPWACSEGRDYRDGWRQESFDAIDGESWHHMPWYFRTMASWQNELRAAGFRIVSIDEPIDPQTTKPLSILFVCTGQP